MRCSRVLVRALPVALAALLALGTAQAWGFAVTVGWDPPTQYTDGSTVPGGAIGGYKVYYGTTSGTYPTVLDVGNVTSKALTGLSDSVPTYVVVTAYPSAAGPESAVSAPELVLTPPPPPVVLPPGLRRTGWFWRR